MVSLYSLKTNLNFCLPSTFYWFKCCLNIFTLEIQITRQKCWLWFFFLSVHTRTNKAESFVLSDHFQFHPLFLALMTSELYRFQPKVTWHWNVKPTVTLYQRLSGTRMMSNYRWEQINVHPGCIYNYYTTLISLFCLSQLGGRIQSIAGGQYLEIQDVRTHDSGQYSCVVTNIAGSTSKFFTVEILCKFVPLTLMMYQAHMND